MARSATGPVEQSVVLTAGLNGTQQMLLHDAWPGLRFSKKANQMHIHSNRQRGGEIALSFVHAEPGGTGISNKPRGDLRDSDEAVCPRDRAACAQRVPPMMPWQLSRGRLQRSPVSD